MPELLDQLPPNDASAIRIREDLKSINSLMRTANVMARCLSRYGPPRVVIDIGAGDGTFMLRVARRLAPRWRDVTVVLVDQHDIVDQSTLERFAALHWKPAAAVANVFEFLDQ